MPDDYSLLRSFDGRLVDAARYANEHYLGQAFGSTPIHARLLSQRFLMRLSKNGETYYSEDHVMVDASGKRVSIPPDKMIKLRISDDPFLNSISYQEAKAATCKLEIPEGYTEEAWLKKKNAFLKACDEGRVAVEPNIEALKLEGFQVEHILHRPNHSLHHAIRVAAFIPMILGFFRENKKSDDIEQLQRMMLFSVVGRQDETGFHETGDYGDGITTYQKFRSQSGLAFLDYCGAPDATDYRDALVVELMGFDDVNEALRALPGGRFEENGIIERILKDTKRLVEMGALTPDEALKLEKAQHKESVAKELAAVIQDPSNPRYLLPTTIPQVLVRYLLQNIKKLPPEERSILQKTPKENQEAEAKKMIAKILASEDKRDKVFPFLDRGVMNDALGWMNIAHGLDLSRCYPLKANETGQSECLGNLVVFLDNAFQRSKDWPEFCDELKHIHELLYSVQEMQLRHGERLNFLLHPKERFEVNRLSYGLSDLYKKLKANPETFAEKFAKESYDSFYNIYHSQSYKFGRLFHIFSGTKKEDVRDFKQEAIQCVRAIDSSPKPTLSLKSEDSYPIIQSLHLITTGDIKKITLDFLNAKELEKFQKMHQELCQPANETCTENSVTISFEDYKYLRDNRFLKYKLETVPEHLDLEDEVIDTETGEYQVLKLIRESRAVVRLHSTLPVGIPPYEYDLMALDNPSKERRALIPRRFQQLSFEEERLQHQHPLTRQTTKRTYHIELEAPSPSLQEPQGEYQRELEVPNAIYRHRGSAKNTRFIPKSAHTLLNPKGTTDLFAGALGTRHQWFPIGILSDLQLMHRGGDKYVWCGSGFTWHKLWLGSPQKRTDLPQGISIEDLKTKQRQGPDPNEHNELLIRATKEAIKGLFSPQNTLIDRLNLLAQAFEIKKRHKMSVPLMILDPLDPTCPKPYTEEMMRADLHTAFKAHRTKQFPYHEAVVVDQDESNKVILRQREVATQDKILQQLLSLCQFDVDETRDHEKIDNFIDELQIPGGLSSEMKAFKNGAAFDALSIEKKNKFFIKQVALGHGMVIDAMFGLSQYRPERSIVNKALEIAARHEHLELVQKLSKLTEVMITKSPKPAVDDIEAQLRNALDQFIYKRNRLDRLCFSKKPMRALRIILEQNSKFDPSLRLHLNKLFPSENSIADLWSEVNRRLKALTYAIQLAESTKPQTEKLTQCILEAKAELQSLLQIEQDMPKRLTKQVQEEVAIDVIESFNQKLGPELAVSKAQGLIEIWKKFAIDEQIKAALTQWISHPISERWVMNAECQRYLEENAWVKPNLQEILLAISRGDLTALETQDPVLMKRLREQPLPKEASFSKVLDMALARWRENTLTQHHPFSEASIQYILQLTNKEHFTKILTNIWQGNIQGLFATDDTFEGFIEIEKETLDLSLPIEKCLKFTKMRLEHHPSKLSPEFIKACQNCLEYFRLPEDKASLSLFWRKDLSLQDFDEKRQAQLMSKLDKPPKNLSNEKLLELACMRWNHQFSHYGSLYPIGAQSNAYLQHLMSTNQKGFSDLMRMVWLRKIYVLDDCPDLGLRIDLDTYAENLPKKLVDFILGNAPRIRDNVVKTSAKEPCEKKCCVIRFFEGVANSSKERAFLRSKADLLEYRVTVTAILRRLKEHYLKKHTLDETQIQYLIEKAMEAIPARRSLNPFKAYRQMEKYQSLLSALQSEDPNALYEASKKSTGWSKYGKGERLFKPITTSTITENKGVHHGDDKSPKTST